jgi:hypothetical protein
MLGDEPIESADLATERRHESRRAEEDETHYSVTLPVNGEPVHLRVPGDDVQEVIQTVLTWLETVDDPDIGDGDWRTVDVDERGQRTTLTFRASWVSSFTITKKEYDR